MNFVITEKQLEKIEEWKKTLPKEPPTAMGGAFTYMFTPTGLGIIIRIRYYNGQELDLTDYDNF